MSDDEDMMMVKKPKVHYGSLEEQEKARLAALAAAAKEGVDDSGQELGDIQISSGRRFFYSTCIFNNYGTYNLHLSA